MRTKTVYFVRHGESEGNASNFVQSPEAQLTQEGHRQARLIAKRCKHIDFELLIASDMQRAQQTAHAIADETGHEIMSDLRFREVGRPSSLHGESRMGKAYQHYLSEFSTNMTKKDWQYEDAENFYDLVARARGALAHIDALPAEHVLVVTHALFLKTMVSVMLLQEELTPAAWEKMVYAIGATNTGVTTCTITDGAWMLRTWNDRAHFAE